MINPLDVEGGLSKTIQQFLYPSLTSQIGQNLW